MMVIEEGTRDEFKHCLFHGFYDTAKWWLEGVESRGLLRVDRFHTRFGTSSDGHYSSVTAYLTALKSCSAMSADLHIGTWINWYGLSFVLEVYVCSNKYMALCARSYDPTPPRIPSKFVEAGPLAKSRRIYDGYWKGNDAGYHSNI